jgi:uncharacterized damage-inducible protein DinB
MQTLSPIPTSAVPAASDPLFQHLLDTYASETNKVADCWSRFQDADLPFRPHPRSSSVLEILKHQLLSERRFFGEFLNLAEPPAAQVLPSAETVKAYHDRLIELALPRLQAMAGRVQSWWLEPVPFFDVRRQRIWIFWRRVLHTAEHRTQLTVALRLLEKPVPAIYGPSADERWAGADPTTSVDAAGRK